jgi:hypothetical protein
MVQARPNPVIDRPFAVYINQQIVFVAPASY